MKSSINTIARVAGCLYLALIFIGLFSVVFVRERLIVPQNVTATANNIIASQFLSRAGIVADLVMHVLDIPIMLMIYLLLVPVNKNIALLALLFNLIQTAVLVANKLHLVAALLPLENLDYLKNINQYQLFVQAYLSLKLHDIGFAVGLIFFGFTCLTNGYLIFRSKYLPKMLGLLMQIAGLCYLLNSFILLLAPKFSSILIMIPCLIAELSFCLWLILKGINISIWEEKSIASHSMI